MNQEDKILFLIGVPPALLSIAGSSLVIIMVLRSRNWNSYKRILLGLSTTDVVASLNMALRPFLQPKEISSYEWAMGNSTTCAVTGFAAQFSMSTLYYNCALSFYYLLTIRFGVKDRTFSRRYEPYIHTFCVLCPLVFAIAGAVMREYQQAKTMLLCYILDDEDGGNMLLLLLGTIVPASAVMVLLVVNNLVIYVYVKRTSKRPERFVLDGAITCRSKPPSSQSTTPSSTNPSSTMTTPSSHIPSPSQRRIREVAIQSFLYVGCFGLTYLPTLIFVRDTMRHSFVLLLISMFLLPLQGFFNAFIYARPRYISTRSRYPDQSRWWALRRAFFESTTTSLVRVRS